MVSNVQRGQREGRQNPHQPHFVNPAQDSDLA